MAEPPYPYDQLTLCIKVAELGGDWDKVMFKFPAGSWLDPGMNMAPSARAFWRCNEHLSTLLDQGRGRVFRRDAALAIAAREINKKAIGQIVDVAPFRPGVCDRCNERDRFLAKQRGLTQTKPPFDWAEESRKF